MSGAGVPRDMRSATTFRVVTAFPGVTPDRSLYRAAGGFFNGELDVSNLRSTWATSWWPPRPPTLSRPLSRAVRPKGSRAVWTNR